MDMESLVAEGRVADVRRALRDLDDAGRAALATRLPRLVRARNVWQFREAEALAMVVGGCAPSAARAAAVLGRSAVELGDAAGPAFIEAAGARGVVWLADLGYRIAARLTPADPWWAGWEFAAALLRHTGSPPPQTDAFVMGWVLAVRWRSRPDAPGQLVGRLHSDPFLDALLERGCVHGSLRLALRVLAEPEPQLGGYAMLLLGLRPDQPAFPSRWPLLTLPAPQAVVLTRLVEVGARARSDPRPGLLAAPVRANGALDAGVLVDRLAALGEREPWPGDLGQALLRLPAVVDDDAAKRAEALRTPAGDHLAAWLRRGGLPRPHYEVVAVTREAPWWTGGRTDPSASDPPPHLLVAAAPPDVASDRFGLLTRRPVNPSGFRDNAADLWPAVLPGYRGLAAAWVLPIVAAAFETPWRGGNMLPALAACAGDGGPAVELAVAYGLAAKREVDRVGTVDALLTLAATGQLDAAATGARLGELVQLGVLTWSRCLGPLRDAAAAGARLATWRMLAAALPTVLAMPKPPPGTPDLLTLAADTAAASGEAIAVPGLAEVAARRGQSRLVTEARRLAAAIG